MEQEFHRIKRLPPYVLAEVNALKAKARAAAAGWQVPAPQATMFVWAPLPEPFAHLGSLAFSKLLLTEAKAAVSPGVGFGEYGDGHVRFALVENKHRIRQDIRNIKAFFRSADKSLEKTERRRLAS